MRLRIRELTCACCGGRINKNNASACPDCDALLHLNCWEHGCSGEKVKEGVKLTASGRHPPPPRKARVRWRRVGGAALLLSAFVAPFLFLGGEDERTVVVPFEEIAEPVVFEDLDVVYEDEAAPELTPDEPLAWNAIVERAVANYNAGDFDGALVDLQRVAEWSPTSPRVQLYLGLTYYELGCPKVAIRHYTQVIDNNPDYSLLYLAYYNRSWNRMLTGDRAGALVDAEVAGHISPANERFARYMALLYDLSGERGEAEGDLRRAVELDVRAVRPRVWLAAYTGDSSALLGVATEDTFGQVASRLRGQLSESELLDWVEANDPQYLGEVHFLLGLQAERQGALGVAREHYAKCLERGGPGDVDRSWARSRLERLSED